MWPIIDQITGDSCPLCQQPGYGLCAACSRRLPYNHHPCPRCALPHPAGAPADVPCAACQAHPPAFDRATAPLVYAPPVDDLVAGFKYHHRLDLGPLLARILAAATAPAAGRTDLLVPVPASPARLSQRGFNQAAELARYLALALSVPWTPGTLVRLRGDAHQQALGRGRRLRNVRGAFAVRGRLLPRVTLVDDVMTTGATAHEASRVLKRAGVDRVEVWTVARTPLDRPGG